VSNLSNDKAGVGSACPAPPSSQIWIQAAEGYSGLAAATELAISLARQAQLPADKSYGLRLAVDELATNVLMHGYPNGDGQLLVEGAVDNDRVWVSLTDWAPPFDPAAAPTGFPAASAIHTAKPGGVGLALVHQSTDRLCYQRRQDANYVVVEIARRSEEPR